MYSVGSFTHCSFAGTLALVVRSVTVGNRALRSFLTPSSCCPACPLVDSHLFFGHLSRVLVCPGSYIGVGYSTTRCPTGCGWAGTIASSPALRLAPRPEVRSVGLASCTRNGPYCVLWTGRVHIAGCTLRLSARTVSTACTGLSTRTVSPPSWAETSPWNSAKPVPMFWWSRFRARLMNSITGTIVKSSSVNEDRRGSFKAFKNCRFRMTSVGGVSRRPSTAWNRIRK